MVIDNRQPKINSYPLVKRRT